MSEVKCREYRILLTNGREVQLAHREMQLLYVGRRTIILSIIAIFAVAIFAPFLVQSTVDYTARVFYKLYFAVLYIVLAPIWMSFFYKYWVRVFSDTIPLAIYSAPLVIVLTSIAMMTSGAIDGLVPGYDYPIKWTSYLVNLSAVHIVETIAFVWLLPKLREELAEIEDATGKRPLVEYAIINGRSVPLSQIKMVQSAEHYLIVATDNGSTEYRARLKDFLEQVTPEHGIQTHRSHWISTAEALSLFGNTVKTRSGEDVPVSRGRYEEVRQWFRKMGKPF